MFKKLLGTVLGVAVPSLVFASEADLVLPNLSSVNFQGINGHALLLSGLLVCALGLLFGMWMFRQIKNMPVHRSMKDISELIYAICKTYLVFVLTLLRIRARPLQLWLANLSLCIRFLSRLA